MESSSLDSRANDWAVVHRIINDEGPETRIMKLRIRDVPESKGRKEIKQALERAGRVFGEGTIPWGNHAILPRDQWVDLDNSPADTVTFSDILDEALGEKRVTLRLPIGLHAQLVKAASGKSFNQFVTDTLAVAIGYSEELLEPALPRIAARRGISEDELRENLAQMSAKDTSQSPLGKEFGEHLSKLATLPPEQLKARYDALLSSPEWTEAMKTHERIKNGEDIFADVPDEQIEMYAQKLGLTVEKFRERMVQHREKMQGFDMDAAIKLSREKNAEETKDTTLMLRDVFTGSATSLIAPEQ